MAIEMVKIRNITDHERDFQVGRGPEGPWLAVGPGDVVAVRREIAEGWPAVPGKEPAPGELPDPGLCAVSGLVDGEKWDLVDVAPSQASTSKRRKPRNEG